MPTYYPQTWKVEAEGYLDEVQSGLHRETISKEKEKRNKLSAFINI